jgi:hypothetical protein
MARVVFCIALSMVVLLPKPGNAQVSTQTIDQPNQPIIVNGLVYHPTAETRFFDPRIMAQVAIVQSTPIYADVTLEPNSVVYLPVSRYLVRGYERKREGDLAGTEGSRVPAFPIEIPSSIGATGQQVPPAIGTSGSAVIGVREPNPAPPIPERTHVVSIPPPSSNDGVWLVFEGARWYSRGSAVAFRSDRFTRIGDYRGFAVYRDKNGRADEIWVASVKDGPLAPYARR